MFKLLGNYLKQEARHSLIQAQRNLLFNARNKRKLIERVIKTQVLGKMQSLGAEEPGKRVIKVPIVRGSFVWPILFLAHLTKI